MPGIKESLLQQALPELEGIRNRRYAAARYESMDWEEIEQQLGCLRDALTAGNEYVFHTTLDNLQQLLRKEGEKYRLLISDVVRDEQPSGERPVPPPVL